MRKENLSKNTVPVFPRRTKSRKVYISSNWIEMVFIIEEKYEEN